MKVGCRACHDGRATPFAALRGPGAERILAAVEASGSKAVPLLCPADFDAFLELTSPPSRAGQGPKPRPSAQRRGLRERIEAWAGAVLPRLRQIGLGLEVVVPDEVDQHLSSRAPRSIAQRVLFVRDDFARADLPRSVPELDPLSAHAHLVLTIDSVHVAVSLEVGPDAEADVRNLRARIADPTSLLELSGLLAAMPDEFAIGVLGVPSFPHLKSTTADDIRALLDDSQRVGRPLWIGWSIKREVALAHAASLGEQLGDALVALAHVYKLVAWATDNDLIAAGGRGAWRSKRARVVEERRERGREERRTRRADARDKRTTPRAEGTRREREDARRRPKVDLREPASRRAGAEEATPESAPGRLDQLLAGRLPNARRPILPTTLRARGARLPFGLKEDPQAPVEKGSKVLVLDGPFEGKTGVVEELDGRGRAKVRLGLLAATLELGALVATTDDSRPRLLSSHRRVRRPR